MEQTQDTLLSDIVHKEENSLSFTFDDYLQLCDRTHEVLNIKAKPDINSIYEVAYLKKEIESILYNSVIDSDAVRTGLNNLLLSINTLFETFSDKMIEEAEKASIDKSNTKKLNKARYGNIDGYTGKELEHKKKVKHNSLVKEYIFKNALIILVTSALLLGMPTIIEKVISPVEQTVYGDTTETNVQAENNVENTSTELITADEFLPAGETTEYMLKIAKSGTSILFSIVLIIVILNRLFDILYIALPFFREVLESNHLASPDVQTAVYEDSKDIFIENDKITTINKIEISKTLLSELIANYKQLLAFVINYEVKNSKEVEHWILDKTTQFNKLNKDLLNASCKEKVL